MLSLVSKENEIADQVIVKCLVFGFVAVKEQKRVNEQGKVTYQRNIECSVVVDDGGIDLKFI